MRLRMVSVPYVLYLAEDGRVDFVYILELINDQREMTRNRLSHNDLKQIALMR